MWCISMGTNFGLNDTLVYREISLDSYDSIIGNSGYPSSDWPTFTMPRPLGDLAALKVLEVQIPFTWYTINTYNNTFTLDDGVGSAKVTITPGNYDSSQMITELQNDLHTASVAAGGSYTYTVTYSSITQKFTIVSSQTSGNFSLVFGDFENYEGDFDPSVMLGFRYTNTSSTYSVGNPSTLVAPYVAQLTGPNYLYLNSVKMGQLTNMYLPAEPENHTSQADGIGPQIAKIPVNVNPGGVINWQDPDPQKWFDIDRQNNLSQIDFYLTLGNWNWGWPSNIVPLPLNGANFSIKLGLLLNQMDHTEVMFPSVNGGVASITGPRIQSARKRPRK